MIPTMKWCRDVTQWSVCVAVLFCSAVSYSQDFHIGASIALDTTRLREIEERVLPECLVDGPARFDNLPDYYFAENFELTHRFRHAQQTWTESVQRPFQMITLIAGSAGTGKTFLKKEVFGRQADKEKLCSFDIRELYEQWAKEGKVAEKPDLHSGGVVLNTLLALKEPRSTVLFDFLTKKGADFYVIDSLDEIHPDDHSYCLEEIERFAFESNKPFVHIVVLGRGLAFRNYWMAKAGYYPAKQLNLYMLESPIFKTTGDLMVSTWNYHQFSHKLCWKKDSGRGAFSFDDYGQWAKKRFSRTGPFQLVSMEPANALDHNVEATLEAWACRYPYINNMLQNLAGNGIIREIVDAHARAGWSHDEATISQEYFAKWLIRDTKSDGRPSATKPEHLDLYLQLLEAVAVKYTHEDTLDCRGFFPVTEDDVIEVHYRGQRLSFPVEKILNCSGLKYMDPRTPGPPRYRFEPIWVHRMLVERSQNHGDSVSR